MGFSADDYLEHHGIKGQKWGVRRFRNYDGTYTKRGLERYDRSSKNYNRKKNSYEFAKALNRDKSFEVDRSEIKRLKTETKIAKQQMNKDYKRLKQDYLADQGKDIYRSGRTITTNKEKVKGFATAAGIAAGAAYVAHKLQIGPTKNVMNPINGIAKVNLLSAGSAAVAAGSAAAAGILHVHGNMEAKKLRAYYAH